MIAPKTIKRAESSISVEWSDGSVTDIAAGPLRRACPCASCREERGEGRHDKPIRKTGKMSLRVVEHTAMESTTIDTIRPIGNYALNITWKDGHSTGIYPYALLLELASKRD
jgi:DUF971 family protein